MWPRKDLVEEVHYGGEGAHWAVAPTKKKKISNAYIGYICTVHKFIIHIDFIFDIFA